MGHELFPFPSVLLFLLFCTYIAGSVPTLGFPTPQSEVQDAVEPSASSQVIKIGALVPFDGTSYGSAVNSACRLAVQTVNADPNFLPGYELQLLVANSSWDQFQGQAAALQLLLQDVVALVGPHSSSQAALLGSITADTQTPLISPGATDMTLTGSSEYPSFFRASHSDRVEMQAIADIISHFKWREVVVVYINNRFGRNGATALQDISVQNGDFDIILTISIDPTADAETVTAALAPLVTLPTSLVVMHVENALTESVIEQAYDIGLFTKGYVWISTEGAMSDLLVTDPSSDLLRKAQGLIGTTSFAPPSPELDFFMRIWKNLDPETYPGAGTSEVNVYVLMTYDAIMLLSHALDDFIQASPSNFSRLDAQDAGVDSGLMVNTEQSSDSWARVLHLPADGGSATQFGQLGVRAIGLLLQQALVNTSFMGASGRFDLDPITRDRRNQSFQLHNLLPNGSFVPIGLWNQEEGLLSSAGQPLPIPLAFSTSAILGGVSWPGNQSETPLGWFPKFSSPLRIAIPNKKGYNQFISINNTKQGNDRFTGFCVQVFLESLKLLPYNVPFEFYQFGQGNSTPSYTQMVKSVANNTYDAAVGDVTITDIRSKIVDFTQPYEASGLSLIVYTPVEENPWRFTQPFTAAMWGCIFAAFLYTAIVIWFLEHWQNREFGGKPHQQVITAIWFSFSTMVLRQEKTVKTTLGRIAIVAWLIVVLIVFSGYTANLTSIITVQRLTPAITDVTQLVNARLPVGFQAGSFVQGYMEALGVDPSLLIALNNEQEYYSALSTGRVYAIVDEEPYLDIFMDEYCNVEGSTQPFANLNFGFVFQQNSRLAQDLSTAVANLTQSGQLQTLHDTWLVGNGQCSSSSSTVSFRLGLGNLWGLYLIYAVVSVACVVAYFGVLVYRGKRAFREIHRQRVPTSAYEEEGIDGVPPVSVAAAGGAGGGGSWGSGSLDFQGLGLDFQGGSGGSASSDGWARALGAEGRDSSAALESPEETGGGSPAAAGVAAGAALGATVAAGAVGGVSGGGTIGSLSSRAIGNSNRAIGSNRSSSILLPASGLRVVETMRTKVGSLVEEFHAGQQFSKAKHLETPGAHVSAIYKTMSAQGLNKDMKFEVNESGAVRGGSIVRTHSEEVATRAAKSIPRWSSGNIVEIENKEGAPTAQLTRQLAAAPVRGVPEDSPSPRAKGRKKESMGEGNAGESPGDTSSIRREGKRVSKSGRARLEGEALAPSRFAKVPQEQEQTNQQPEQQEGQSPAEGGSSRRKKKKEVTWGNEGVDSSSSITTPRGGKKMSRSLERDESR